MTTIRTVDLPADVTSTKLLHTVNKQLKIAASRAGTVAAETLQFVDISAQPITAKRVSQLHRQKSLWFSIGMIGIALFVLSVALAATGGAGATVAIAIALAGFAAYCSGYIGVDSRSQALRHLMFEAKDDVSLQKTLQHAIHDADMRELRELAKHQEFVTRYNLGQALNDRFALAEGNIPTALPAVIAA